MVSSKSSLRRKMTAAASRNGLPPIGGDAYKILAEWPAASKDSVVVDLYYLMFSETPPVARYTVIMYTGDSETTNVPINNPPSSCDEGREEIKFQERARVQADISAKVRKSAVDVTISLKNTAEKMRTQGAQITEAGESTSSRNEPFSFTPLADEDLTQYGLIVTFNQDVIGGIKEYPTHYSQWVKIKQDNV